LSKKEFVFEKSVLLISLKSNNARPKEAREKSTETLLPERYRRSSPGVVREGFWLPRPRNVPRAPSSLHGSFAILR